MNTAPEVIEQTDDVPDGGSIAGELPRAAVAVVTVGTTTVRTIPALQATLGQITFSANAAPQRLGRDATRRRLLLSVRALNSTGVPITTAFVVLAENAQQAASGYGLTLPAPTVLPPIEYAGELHFAAFGLTAGDTLAVGFLAEIEQG